MGRGGVGAGVVVAGGNTEVVFETGVVVGGADVVGISAEQEVTVWAENRELLIYYVNTWMKCDSACPLTVVTLDALADKSLNEHVPQCLIDESVFNDICTLARIAGVQVYFCYMRRHSNSFGI